METNPDARIKRILSRASPDRLADLYLERDSLTITDNIVYHAWSDYEYGEVFFSYSNDGGKSFSTPKNISNDRSNEDHSPRLGAFDKSLCILWHKFGYEELNGDIFFSYSNDGGTSFSTPKNISNYNVDQYGLEAKTDHNNMYICWKKINDPKYYTSDIVFSYSNDGGKSFSTPKNISDDRLARNGTPVIDTDGNKILVAWPEHRTHTIRFSYSNDGGTSFSTPLAIISHD